MNIYKRPLTKHYKHCWRPQNKPVPADVLLETRVHFASLYAGLFFDLINIIMEIIEKHSDENNLVKKARGGVRPGAGRPAGSLNKLSGGALLEAIEQANNGVPYEVTLANDFLNARFGDDQHLVAKYHQMILSKVIADKVDITSNGQSIAPVIELTATEIPDYLPNYKQ